MKSQIYQSMKDEELVHYAHIGDVRAIYYLGCRTLNQRFGYDFHPFPTFEQAVAQVLKEKPLQLPSIKGFGIIRENPLFNPETLLPADKESYIKEQRELPPEERDCFLNGAFVVDELSPPFTPFTGTGLAEELG